MEKGRLIVISGPSGTGKGSIVRGLMEKRDDLELSVSMTTRPKREGEEDGVHYYFVDKDDFEKAIAQDGLLEWANVYGNYYGTPRQAVEDRLAKGKNVILEIDTQGGRNIKSKEEEALMVFILPPSLAELERRIRGRATDSEEVIKARLAKAKEEIREAVHYEHVVVNDILEEAVELVSDILDGKTEPTENIEDLIKRYEEEEDAVSIDQ